MRSRRLTSLVGPVALAVVVAFGLGYAVRRGCARREAPREADHAHGAGAEPAQQEQAPEVWTCSMHPQIRRPKPGLCPLCRMELVPVETEGPDVGERVFVTTEAAAALMEVQTAPVERRFVTAPVRLVGRVAYDETRMAAITARVPGRLDRLYADYTGVPVRPGDHLVEMYSPALLSAQEELLQARAAVRELEAGGVAVLRTTARTTLEAVREKLRLAGLKAEQIRAIEERGKVAEHVTMYAPIGGIVVEKAAVEGVYVETGTRIYTIADLSVVWVRLDAYESDLPWLRYGQPVEFSTVAHPGETFTGTIAFINPVLDERTRTVDVRVNAPNPQGKLKPGMWVRAVVRPTLAAAGRVMDPDLAGRWICPMHPAVVKDAAGDCDVCGMPLEAAESLGYAPADPSAAEPPLVIPASAALVTGTRAVVYVKVPDTRTPTFEGRTVALGPRAGQWYLVESGLTEGEEVVVRGNFKIDSALQIQAKPSMMRPEEDAEAAEAPPKPEPPPLSSASAEGLAAVVPPYLVLAESLAADDFETSRTRAARLADAVVGLDASPFRDRLAPAARRAAEAASIQTLRAAFEPISDALIAAARGAGSPLDGPLYRIHCPMAFDKGGADWLQDTETVANPYFGTAMERCGSVVEVLAPAEEGGPDDE